MFECLPGRVLTDLSQQFVTRKYNVKQYVFHQDDEANHLYVILDGQVSIERVNEEGKVTKISCLNSGEVFGEFALVDGMGRSASALVTKPSNLASLPGRVFEKLFEEHAAFSRQLSTVLVGRLRGSNQQVETLVTMNLLQRTARLLLQISESSGHEIIITQNELAERLFATREKVNSKLKELEALGAIKRGNRRIDILSTYELRKIG